MKEKIRISGKMIKDAVRVINDYYNSAERGEISTEYLVIMGVCKQEELSALISKLEGLELIECYHKPTIPDVLIKRRDKCKIYLEMDSKEHKESRRAFILSVISILIAACSLVSSLISLFSKLP